VPYLVFPPITVPGITAPPAAVPPATPPAAVQPTAPAAPAVKPLGELGESERLIARINVLLNDLNSRIPVLVGPGGLLSGLTKT
jgi:hypothetical protein